MPGLIRAGMEFLPGRAGGHARWEDADDIRAAERAGGAAGVACPH